MSKHLTVVFNSALRNTGSVSSTDYVVGLPFMFPDKTNRRMRLKSVVIPWNYYNVNSTNNSVLVNAITVTITPGSYTAATLAVAIAAALNAAGIGFTGFTCTYSTTTFLFTIGSGAAITFHWESPLSTLQTIIGFPSTLNAATTQVGTTAATLGIPNSLYISMKGFTSNIFIAAQTANFAPINFYIPLTANTGTLIFYEPDFENQWTEHQDKLSQTVNIRLTDQAGNVIPLNADWLFSLDLSIDDCYDAPKNKPLFV